MAVITAGATLAPMAAQAAPADRRAPASAAASVSASGPTAQAAAPRAKDPVVRDLNRIAHPVRSTEPGGKTTDLRALGRMIGDAKVVGLGETTHGSHEFFTMKERLFRHLVREKGFRAFSLELSWSAGLRINDFVQTGKGDARQIAKENLAGTPWDREEFVHLIEWMRDHNRGNPTRTVHFVGNDINSPATTGDFFARITDYVDEHHPALAPRVDELYTGLRSLDDVYAYWEKPLAERKRLADQAQRVVDLISDAGDGRDKNGSGGKAGSGDKAGSGGKDRDAHAWAVQNARSIADTSRFLTSDPDDPATLPEFMRFRDQTMARNVLWWQKRTGHKTLVSAHNDHLGLIASDSDGYPKTQGSFLRDALGRNYLPIGMTFDRGSFLSTEGVIGAEWKKFTVGASPVGSNEHTLDQVRHRDYYVDLRAAAPAARKWLDTVRPTRSIGTVFYDGYPLYNQSFGRSYDALIHLHDVTEAELRKP